MPTPRCVLTFVVLSSLIFSPFLTISHSQERVPGDERRGNPRPGKPEGEVKSLDQLKHESSTARQRQEPIHSTIRSRKMPLRSWDGRRVGDPLPLDRAEAPGAARPNLFH